MLSWKLHGDGKNIQSGEVVGIDERLSWPRTMGMGLQHIVAMFGATFLVPIITGFSPTTTLFFSGIGTLLFIVLTQNKLPSYLGLPSHSLRQSLQLKPLEEYQQHSAA